MLETVKHWARHSEGGHYLNVIKTRQGKGAARRCRRALLPGRIDIYIVYIMSMAGAAGIECGQI